MSSRGGDVALPAGKLGAEGCKSGNKSSSGKTGRYFRKKRCEKHRKAKNMEPGDERCKLEKIFSVASLCNSKTRMAQLLPVLLLPGFLEKEKQDFLQFSVCIWTLHHI